MRNILTICFLLLLPVASASADVLGLYIGGGSWNHDPSGSFGTTQAGSDSIGMKSDLNLTEESEGYVWMAFDHPIPVVPNIRLERTAMSHKGTTSSAFNFNGNPAATGATEVTMDSTDVILYYRLLDNWVNLDLGLNLRKLDGRFAIGNAVAEVSETIPMLYLAAQFDMPLTGLSLGADYKIVGYSGSTYSDIRVRAAYEVGVVGFEAGVRSTSLTLEDVDTVNTDLEFKGLMLGIFLHF